MVRLSKYPYVERFFLICTSQKKNLYLREKISPVTFENSRWSRDGSWEPKTYYFTSISGLELTTLLK